jgi:hypothetical protein
MKKRFLIFVPFVLAACNNKEESHTRSWYRDHDAERKTMVAQCKDDAAKATTPECMNASNADSDIYIYGKDYYKKSDETGNRPADR